VWVCANEQEPFGALVRSLSLLVCLRCECFHPSRAKDALPSWRLSGGFQALADLIYRRGRERACEAVMRWAVIGLERVLGRPVNATIRVEASTP
jgi:hypothetical protein